ncbi:MAG: PD-(D/E)XK nuclease family protein [Candidatus Levyibacteriota bacterium]
MNKLLQTAVIGTNLQDIHPDLPSGIVDVQEGFLRSVPIPGALDCFISGRFDIVSKLDDGTYSVIDFKITSPDAEQIKKFSSQLHAYKFALENPAEGAPIKISQMGLISVTPESVDYKDGRMIFTADPKWHPIDEDMDSFFGLIKEISGVLNGELPKESETCTLCIYRKKFEPQLVTSDIPF